MAERRSEGWLTSVAAGLIIGALEVVLAVSFAAFVFGGYLVQFLPTASACTSSAAALTLAILAWRAGARGVVGSVQDAAAAVLAVVAATAASRGLEARFGEHRHRALPHRGRGDLRRDGPLRRHVPRCSERSGSATSSRSCPYPVVGGFLAGTGWLLLKGGIRVAAGMTLEIGTIDEFVDATSWSAGSRRSPSAWSCSSRPGSFRRPLVIPVVLGIGFVLFAIGMLVTGSSIETATGRRVAARAVRVDPAVGAVDLPRAHRRRLVGRARPGARDRDRGVRRRARDACST